MPLYEYECSACGKSLEEMRQVSNYNVPAVCPVCGGSAKFILAFSQRGDNLYPYIDEYIAPHPIEINSRAHYLRELKKRGLVEVCKRDKGY